MITLSRDASLLDLEDFCRDIYRNPGQDIRLPIGVKHGGGFGFASTCVLTIATWARLHGGIKAYIFLRISLVI